MSSPFLAREATHAAQAAQSPQDVVPGGRIRLRTFATALGLCGVVLLGATGCADSSSSLPDVASPVPTAAASTAPTSYGDVIERVTIKDDLGTYTSTTINPDSEAYSALVSNVDPAIYANGFTEADALSAQQWVAKFVAEEVTDSTAVDGSGWEAWKANVGPQYVTGPFAQDMMNPAANSTDDRSSIIVNNPNNSIPNLARDGTPRFTSNVIDLNKMENVDYEGSHYIKVIGTSETSYRVDNEVAIQWAMERNDLSKETVLANVPFLNEGNEVVYFNSLDFSYTLEKTGDGAWSIVGYTNHYRGDLAAK